jgi:hypothetical protein
MPLNAKQFTILIFLALFLAACGSAEPTQDVNSILTQSVGTMVASFFGTQTAVYTPPSPTSTMTQTPFPTPTQFPTSTSPPTATQVYLAYFSPTPGTLSPLTPVGNGTFVTATVNPLVLGAGCNNAAFIRDVTVPDGTVFKPGENFVKTWKVENNGSCKWMPQYSLVLLSGTDMDAGTTKIQKIVEVGDWSELSVDITAPKKEGTYTSYWRLADAEGVPFGATLAVVIEVVK